MHGRYTRIFSMSTE